MTQDEIFQMLQNLMSEEYAAGQENNPEGYTKEPSTIDPFAQFSAPNEGLLSQNFRKSGAAYRKPVPRGPVQGPMAEPAINLSKFNLTPEITGTPSFVDAATNLRRNQNAADEKLTKNLESQALPLKLLAMFAPLVGAAAPYLRGSARSTPPPMAGPLPIPKPNTAPQTKPQLPPMIGVPEFPTPVIRPSANSAPKGPYKFTKKGAKEYIKRQSRNPENKPEWVKRGAKELDYIFKTKKKENPFEPKPAPGEMSPLEQLIAAGKNVMTGPTRVRQPKAFNLTPKKESLLSLRNIMNTKPVVMTPEEELEMIRKSFRNVK